MGFNSEIPDELPDNMRYYKASPQPTQMTKV